MSQGPTSDELGSATRKGDLGEGMEEVAAELPIAGEEPAAGVQAPEPRRRYSLPKGVSAHAVLAQIGVLVPQDVEVNMSPHDPGLFAIGAPSVGLAPTVRPIQHAGVVYLRNGNSISGSSLCRCEGAHGGRGSGSCFAMSGDDTSGNPGLGCYGRNCKGHCTLYTKIDPPVMATAVLRSVGVDLGPDSVVVGDMFGKQGVLLTACEVGLRPGSSTEFVEGLNGQVIMRRKGGGTIASWECSCARGKGGCAVRTTQDSMSCVRTKSCSACALIIVFAPQDPELAPT